MESTLELELARMRIIRADYGLLDAYCELNRPGAGAIAEAFANQDANINQITFEREIADFIKILGRFHPQLKSVHDDLDEIIDLLNDNAGLDESNVRVRLTNILETLKEVGQYLSITGRRIGGLNKSWSITPNSAKWTDDNLLKEAHDLISEFIERVFS